MMLKGFFSALFTLAFCAQALALSDSDVPAKVPTPWGNAAVAPYIRTVPIASQIGIQNCAASFADGFPPLTFQPSTAGGCPPFGADMNGILARITQWTRWQNAGNPVFYDGTFSSLVGGYPKWATLQNASTPGCQWISTVDGNTSNPDAAGANWFNTCPAAGSAITITNSGTRLTIDQPWQLSAGALSTSPTTDHVLVGTSSDNGRNFQVTGTSSFSGNALFSSTETVQGLATFNAGVSVSGAAATLNSGVVLGANGLTFSGGSTQTVGAATVAFAKNSSRLNTTATPGSYVQALRQQFTCQNANDLMDVSAFQEVTTSEVSSNAFVQDRLFVSTNPASTQPAIGAEYLCGSSQTACNALNVTPDMHHYTFQARGSWLCDSTGTWYAIYAILWDTDLVTAGAINPLDGIQVTRMRNNIGTLP